MKTKELILNGEDIKELFMDNNVDEIWITTNTKAFNLTEQELDTEMDECLGWERLVDFGMKNIIADWCCQVLEVSYDKVYAVKVEWKGNYETVTFINKNFTKIINQ